VRTHPCSQPCFYPNFPPPGALINPHQVAFDLKVIARDYPCSAVRITGADIERLTAAANAAADVGLKVWFSPFPCKMEQGDMLTVIEQSADRAEAVTAEIEN
jgi:hypothetical protein